MVGIRRLFLAVGVAAVVSQATLGAARADVTLRASLTTTGGEPDSGSDAPSLSADGQLVAFSSIAINVHPDDTDTDRDIFLRDLVAGTTELISVSTAGVKGNKFSNRPALSGSGRLVVFESFADNLVAMDTNSRTDVFVRDRMALTTDLVSVDEFGVQLNGQSGGPVITPDGRYVAFRFVPTVGSSSDILVRDLQTQTTARVDAGPLGEDTDAFSSRPAISADGRFVAFQSRSQSLVPGGQNGSAQIYVRDRDVDADGIFDEPGAVATERISVAVSDATLPGNGDSRYPALSSDGRYVVYQSEASNLVANDICNNIDIFVRDRQLGTTTRLSVIPAARADTACVRGGNGNSTRPSISGNGRMVIFQSGASDLIASDGNASRDVFVRDRDPDVNGVMDEASAVTTRVSVDSSGAEVTGISGSEDHRSAVSLDGRVFGFASQSAGLVPSDMNLARDVFVRLPLVCGDGQVNTATGEQCDDGNLVDDDGCDRNCTFTACGNGVVTPGEICDDGNTLPGDGCESDCKPTGCGDGVTSGSEECDDANATDGDGCDVNCTITSCGNGIRTGSEVCDDGAQNGTVGSECSLGCTLAAPVGTSLYPVTPCRLRDTRSGAAVGGAPHTLFSDEILTVAMEGNACGIPTDAVSLVLNVTAVAPSAGGFLTVFPTAETPPLASTLNFKPGRTRANNGLFKAARDGRGISFYNGSGGSVELVIDVTGYFK